MVRGSPLPQRGRAALPKPGDPHRELGGEEGLTPPSHSLLRAVLAEQRSERGSWVLQRFLGKA